MFFEFDGFYIRVQRTPTGTTLALSGSPDFPEDDTRTYSTTSRDPLNIATLLRSDLDLRYESDLEELAGLIDAHL
jgi:hypothetical protein